MKETVEFLAKHGYWILFAGVLGRQACLPVPANLLLLAAGALAGLGTLNLAGIIALSVTAFLLADLAWYGAGRRWGSKTLHFFCGAAQDPRSCVGKMTKSFSRHGVKSLLFSKFIIGLDAVAAPMSGISGVSLPIFLMFDALGAILWSSTYMALGYFFSDQLDRVARYAAQTGKLVILAGIAGLGVMIIRKFVQWYRFLREFRLARITPEELRDKLPTADKLLILDLQGRPKRAQGLTAIPGAVRINPHELGRYIRQYRGADLRTDREVIVYCDSPSETRSARVALALRRMGFKRVRPLAGGFQAWLKCGFPVSSNVQMLPLPEHAVYVLREVLQYSRTNAAQLLKTSAADVDRLLERAMKHIRSTVDTHEIMLKRHAAAAPMCNVPVAPSMRQAGTSE
jgi:membrane protein DedA with SNARE-associated domain/rhodanese-related sulfurtransferase